MTKLQFSPTYLKILCSVMVIGLGLQLKAQINPWAVLYAIDSNANTFKFFEPSISIEKDTLHKWAKRKLFYEHLVQASGDDFQLTFDFIPDVQTGYDNIKKRPLYLNTRGFAVQGTLGSKVTFYSDFYENQLIAPHYLDSIYQNQMVAGGQALLRYNIGSMYDFSYSSAYLNYYPNNVLTIQTGLGKNFIGNGYRSVQLSDISPNYPFLGIHTDFWKIHYSVLYAQFVDTYASKLSQDNGYRRKYGVFHQLDIKLNKKLTLGLFESIIWQGADSTGSRGFDVQYLSPIIFLRPVEFSIGSPDNALLGLSMNYKWSKALSSYGQFLLDEFSAKELFSNSGWWANKYAGQIGTKYTSVKDGNGLRALLEYNFAMPYMYSHKTTLLNYANFNQALAHPLGANFKECVAQVSYQKNRWIARYQFNYALMGVDSTNNVGQNIFKSYFTRDAEYGNFLGQGIQSILQYNTLNLAYLINTKTNWRVDLSVTHRTQSNLAQNSNWFIQFGIKSSLRALYFDY